MNLNIDEIELIELIIRIKIFDNNQKENKYGKPDVQEYNKTIRDSYDNEILHALIIKITKFKNNQTRN